MPEWTKVKKLQGEIVRKFQSFGSVLALLLIVGLGGVFRFLDIEKRTIFSGEATNHLFSIARLVDRQESLLVGFPVATYINIPVYTTPWVKYLLAIPYMIFRGNPLSFIFLNSFLGVLGAVLVFYSGKRLISTRVGFYASAIYATWMTVVNLDRSVWNVGLIPFFAALAMYLFSGSYRKPSRKSFFLSGLSLALALSIHLEFFVLAAIEIAVLYKSAKQFSKYLLIPILISFLPLIVYDFSHNHEEIRGLIKIISSLFDGRRPYGSAYFWYQFIPPLTLFASYLLSLINTSIAILALGLFVFWQFRLFISYRAFPNYNERYELVDNLLVFWENNRTLPIYFNDKTSYEYGYLLTYISQKRGIDINEVLILSDEEQSRSNLQSRLDLRRAALEVTSIPEQRVAESLKKREFMLMVDEERLKLIRPLL